MKFHVLLASLALSSSLFAQGNDTVFLTLVSFPVWHNLGARVSTKGPDPVLPKTEKQCVLPVQYMKTSHMALLKDWRDGAIREGQREYVAPDGRRFPVSLTTTCLHQCHTAKGDFCDRCHNYAAVSLNCWDCHQDSKPAAVALGRAAFQAAMPASQPASAGTTSSPNPATRTAEAAQ